MSEYIRKLKSKLDLEVARGKNRPGSKHLPARRAAMSS